MKRLIAIATLGAALGFGATSFATDHMSFYTKSIAKSDVGDKVEGGKVEKDFISFYLSSKQPNKVSSNKSLDSIEKDSYIVFGVEINPERES